MPDPQTNDMRQNR